MKNRKSVIASVNFKPMNDGNWEFSVKGKVTCVCSYFVYDSLRSMWDIPECMSEFTLYLARSPSPNRFSCRIKDYYDDATDNFPCVFVPEFPDIPFEIVKLDAKLRYWKGRLKGKKIYIGLDYVEEDKNEKQKTV